MPGLRPPLSVVLVDVAFLLLAGWTLLCNAVVLLHGTTVHLCWAVAGAAAVLLLAVGHSARRGRLSARLALSSDQDVEASAGGDRDRQPWPLVRIVLLLVAVLIARRFAEHPDLTELWALALGFFLVAYAAVIGSGRNSDAQVSGRTSEAFLWAMAAGCAALTLCAHRPNSDDAFYVNLAVSVVDFPHTPLLAYDTLLGHGVPFKLMAYKAPSVELLGGLVSYLTGIRTLYVCHLILPALAAWLMPLALARLLRLLDRERWVFAVGATLLFLLLDGQARGSYGSFAFVRLFQGKAMLLSTAAPMVIAQGVRFGLAPSKKTFFMLLAVQIAALGTSVTAFWAAPAFALLGILTAIAPRFAAWKTLVLGLLSSGYLLAVGFCMKLLQGGAAALSSIAAPVASAPRGRGNLLEHAYSMVLGSRLRLAVAVTIVLIAWPLGRTPLARRFAVVFPLGFFLVLGNPWLTNRVAAITTTTIYWRVVWLLPVPLLAGLVASSLLQPSRRWQQWVRVPLFALTLALYYTHFSARSSLVGARLSWPPHPKVDMGAYGVAQAIVRLVPAHKQVLAPLAVSRVLPMLNGYSYPLFIKASYLPSDPEDRSWRERLTQAVTHPKPHSPEVAWWTEGIARYHLDGVAMLKERDRRRPLAQALTLAKFHKADELSGHEIWVK